MLQPSDVFTPGKLPLKESNVYAKRTEPERDFQEALRDGMVPLIFGEYGVGKTSMARKSLMPAEQEQRLIYIPSVADKSFDQILRESLDVIGYRRPERRTNTRSTSNELNVSAKIKPESLPLGVGASISNSVATGMTEEFLVASPSDSRIIRILDHHRAVLLLDELHKATDAFRHSLSIFIKTYANLNCDNFRIALLGTSADAAELVKHDTGIDRLVSEIPLKGMSDKEANYIIEKGMDELRIHTRASVRDFITRTAVGSPSIVQYLSLGVAKAAFGRSPRMSTIEDCETALADYINTKAKRLNAQYMKAVETTGQFQFRRRILHAVSDTNEDFVTMEKIRSNVSQQLGQKVQSGALSGPLKRLKSVQHGAILKDVERPDNAGRIFNYTTFSNPEMKLFIRMKKVQEGLDIPKPATGRGSR